MKFKKVIESKVRMGYKKLQAGRQPSVAYIRGRKGFGEMGISIVPDTRTDHNEGGS